MGGKVNHAANSRGSDPVWCPEAGLVIGPPGLDSGDTNPMNMDVEDIDSTN